MMQILLVAALILATNSPDTLGEDAGLAHSGGFVTYPTVSDYSTHLIESPTGPICETTLKMKPLTDETQYGYSIYTSPTGTHLWFTYRGPHPPNPKGLTLYDDGKPFAWITVTNHVTDPSGYYGFQADLPGDMLVKNVLPHLVRGKNITLNAEDQTYAVPNDQFLEVARYIFQCNLRAQKLVKLAP